MSTPLSLSFNFAQNNRDLAAYLYMSVYGGGATINYSKAIPMLQNLWLSGFNSTKKEALKNPLYNSPYYKGIAFRDGFNNSFS